MLNPVRRLLLTALCTVAPIASAASVHAVVSVKVIAAQPGIAFVEVKPEQQTAANTQVARALFEGCDEQWSRLGVKRNSADESELLIVAVRAEHPPAGCGRALKLYSRGRVINIESQQQDVDGIQMMTIKMHY